MIRPERPLLLRISLHALALFLIGLVLSGCRQPTQLERIREGGELIVASRHGPDTVYPGPHGPAGLEHDLIEGFARAIGVRIRYVFPDNLGRLLDQTATASVHMAAAGLTVTPQRRRWMRFSIPYREISERLVYRMGVRRPRSLEQIPPGALHVVARSSHEETLQALRHKLPSLSWIARPDSGQWQLLNELNRGRIDYIVVDSSVLPRARQVFRYLRPGLKLADTRLLAWAFPPAGDDSLIQAANRYLAQIRDNDTLKKLIDHYEHLVDRLDFVAKRDFQRHIRSRLPALKPLFQRAAAESGIDWRLLAAVGYQESHWNPDAVSPTGVRGIMMLTAATAKQLGIGNRRNPKQSILGGARYLRIVEKKVPDRIPEPHRLRLTLAGYNIGFGHLEDARILTQRQGGNPDRWQDVRQRLPLLNRKRPADTLKHGPADGIQAVEYVENIRNYYELLLWFDHHPEDLEAAASPIPNTKGSTRRRTHPAS